MDEHVDVIELTEADLRIAVGNALAHVGLTYAELAEKARTRDFDTVHERLAWIVVRGHRDLAEADDA